MGVQPCLFLFLFLPQHYKPRSKHSASRGSSSKLITVALYISEVPSTGAPRHSCPVSSHCAATRTRGLNTTKNHTIRLNTIRLTGPRLHRPRCTGGLSSGQASQSLTVRIASRVSLFNSLTLGLEFSTSAPFIIILTSLILQKKISSETKENIIYLPCLKFNALSYTYLQNQNGISHSNCSTKAFSPPAAAPSPHHSLLYAQPFSVMM